MQSHNVNAILGPKTIARISDCLDKKSQHLFLVSKEQHFVYGYFNSANILVSKFDNDCKITGILDFAFSGSFLWDVFANMLRYTHKMLLEFQNTFINSF